MIFFVIYEIPCTHRVKISIIIFLFFVFYIYITLVWIIVNLYRYKLLMSICPTKWKMQYLQSKNKADTTSWFSFLDSQSKVIGSTSIWPTVFYCISCSLLNISLRIKESICLLFTIQILHSWFGRAEIMGYCLL